MENVYYLDYKCVRIKLHEISVQFIRSHVITHLAEQDALSSWRHWRYRQAEVFGREGRREMSEWWKEADLNGIRTSSTAPDAEGRVRDDWRQGNRFQRRDPDSVLSPSLFLAVVDTAVDLEILHSWPWKRPRGRRPCTRGDPKSYFQLPSQI